MRDPMVIVLASSNPNKTREIQEILGDGYQVMPMSEVGFTDDIPETGKDFRENAELKADAVRKFLNERHRPYLVLAEDSGLCVDALEGRPGIYTARYGGGCDDATKRKLLLEEMQNERRRSANFTCAMVAYAADGQKFSAMGFTCGRIAEEERGEHGFAFDAVFYSSELKKTLGEATPEEKNRVSHRARALMNIMDQVSRAA